MKNGSFEKGDDVLVCVADIHCSMDPYYLPRGAAMAPTFIGNTRVMICATVVSDESANGTVELEWLDDGDDWGRCYMPNDCCFLADEDYRIVGPVDFEYVVHGFEEEVKPVLEFFDAPDERKAGHEVAAAVMATREGKYGDAVDHMRKAAGLSFVPRAAYGGGNLYNHNTLLLLGEAYTRNGQGDMAQRTYQCAADQRPWSERAALAKEFARRGYAIRIPR